MVAFLPQALAASDKSMSDIGRELGVDFGVASSLRAEQSKVRITSRLIRVQDNEQVWTATFDRELTSILGLQSELSSAIAEQVRLRLSPEVAASLTRRQTAKSGGIRSVSAGSVPVEPALNRQAVAVRWSSTNVLSRKTRNTRWPGPGMAQVLSTAPITGDADPVFVFARARDAVERAVQFGPELSEVQYVLGHFHYLLDWDWPAAESALRRAVAIDPNNALAYLFLGHILSQSGQPLEARLMMRRARELDPLFSHTFALSSQVAFQARDYESAMELARQAIAI